MHRAILRGHIVAGIFTVLDVVLVGVVLRVGCGLVWTECSAGRREGGICTAAGDAAGGAAKSLLIEAPLQLVKRSGVVTEDDDGVMKVMTDAAFYDADFGFAVIDPTTVLPRVANTCIW